MLQDGVLLCDSSLAPASHALADCTALQHRAQQRTARHRRLQARPLDAQALEQACCAAVDARLCPALRSSRCFPSI